MQGALGRRGSCRCRAQRGARHAREWPPSWRPQYCNLNERGFVLFHVTRRRFHAGMGPAACCRRTAGPSAPPTALCPCTSAEYHYVNTTKKKKYKGHCETAFDTEGGCAACPPRGASSAPCLPAAGAFNSVACYLRSWRQGQAAPLGAVPHHWRQRAAAHAPQAQRAAARHPRHERCHARPLGLKAGPADEGRRWRGSGGPDTQGCLVVQCVRWVSLGSLKNCRGLCGPQLTRLPRQSSAGVSHERC